MEKRPPLSAAQKWLLLAIVVAIAFWSWMSMRSNRQEAAREVCQTVQALSEECVYDERYDRWIPESEAR